MDFLIDIVIYIFLIANGFVMGWVVREKVAEAKVNRYLAALQTETKITSDNTLKLDVHVEKDQFYLYNSHNGKFITQVNSKQEMFDFFSKNYPDKNVVMTKEQLSLFDTV